MLDSKIVNGLIPFQEVEEGGSVTRLVNARDIHSYLGLKKRFTDWMKFYIKKYGFVEGEEFITFLGKTPDGGGRPQVEYNVTMDVAKELCMLSATQKGKEARKYFIEVEKKHIENNSPQVQMGEQTSKLFNTILESVKEYSPTASQTVGIKMLEAYGIKVPYNALPLNIEQRWSATEIAHEIGEGTTNTRVGRVATALDLKRMPFGQQRMSVAPNSNKEVTMYYYNEKAKNKITEYIRSNP